MGLRGAAFSVLITSFLTALIMAIVYHHIAKVSYTDIFVPRVNDFKILFNLTREQARSLIDRLKLQRVRKKQLADETGVSTQ